MVAGEAGRLQSQRVEALAQWFEQAVRDPQYDAWLVERFAQAIVDQGFDLREPARCGERRAGALR